MAALDIFTRSSGNARKAGGPALVSALLFAGVLAASSVNRLLGLHLDVGIAATYDVVVMLVAAWLTFDLLAGRWTEATVADLISQLGGEPDPRGVQSALRRALGDPSLVVGYYVAGHAAYVDDTGIPLEVRPTGDQVITTVEEGDAPVAVIIHAVSALDDPELLRAATSAVRLAVGNVVLRQTVHDQMDALTQARRRIVESADRQRSVVAARLEDGAGRHLARVDTLLASLDAADLRSELAQARADLLDLAHGVRPHELAQEGLAGAVAALAARSATPTTVDLRLGRMRPAVESALYFVCAEALTNVAKHANAHSVTIRGRESGGWAMVEVADDGSGGADPAGSGLRGLADRVEALGGQLPGGHHRRPWHRRVGAHSARSGGHPMTPLRVAIADDSMIVREGLALLLADAGHEVVATADSADGLLREVVTHPDLDAVLVDIRMPPTHTDEGIAMARQLRERYPRLGVLVLSQYLESHYATSLLTDAPEHAGYLLKDRVSDVAVLVDALRRVVEGECVVDPTIVARLMRPRTTSSPLDRLTQREREVLALMAEGRSNAAIAQQLTMGDRTLEAHVRQIFQKLDLPPSADDHRRVLAVVRYLQTQSS